MQGLMSAARYTAPGDGWSRGSPEQLCLKHVYKSQPTSPAVLCQQPAAGFGMDNTWSQGLTRGASSEREMKCRPSLSPFPLGKFSKQIMRRHGASTQPRAHPSEQKTLGSAVRGKYWGPPLTKTWPGCDDGDNLMEKPTAGNPQPHAWKGQWEQWDAGSREGR